MVGAANLSFSQMPADPPQIEALPVTVGLAAALSALLLSTLGYDLEGP